MNDQIKIAILIFCTIYALNSTNLHIPESNHMKPIFLKRMRGTVCIL